jgi:hypothetical protein
MSTNSPTPTRRGPRERIRVGGLYIRDNERWSGHVVDSLIGTCCKVYHWAIFCSCEAVLSGGRFGT